MRPINIPEIERQARELRAQEMQRYTNLLAGRLALFFKLLAHSLLSGLRRLFSWNPTPIDTSANVSKFTDVAGNLLTRLSKFGRKLFSWNPQPL
jgi:hypothetical protein